MNNYYSTKNLEIVSADYNLIVSMPKWGKSMAVLQMLINKYIYSGEKIIFLRRYARELSNIDYYLAEMSKILQYDIYRTNDKIYITNINDINHEKSRLLGYAIALNKSNSYRALDFSRTNIFYDDAIGVDIKYLPHEINTLIKFISAVNYTQKTKVYILGNPARQSPYYDLFGVDINREMQRTYLSTIIFRDINGVRTACEIFQGADLTHKIIDALNESMCRRRYDKKE